ncbi:MAG: hypothetical protein AAFO74_03535 [Pseudomonadota bacterium]
MSLSQVQPWHLALMATILIAALVALAPLGLGSDYINHLARTYIEGHLASDPALQKHYTISFDFIPDLTMDLVIPWLSHLIGIYPAGAVTVWLAFILPPLAGVALSKQLHQRATWISLLGFLTVFNANMEWGFVNYAASSGLALLAFALWIRTPPNRHRSVIFTGVSLFLVINHALAFLAFGFLVLAWETICFAHGERGSKFQFLRQLTLLDFPAMALALIFLALSIHSATDLPSIQSPLFSVQWKIQSLFTGTLFRSPPIAMLSTGALIAFFWLSIRQKWLVFAPKTGWLCAAFLVLVVVMPSAIFGIWGLHLRFTGMLIVLTAASVTPTDAFSSAARRFSASTFTALTAIAFANGAGHMITVDRQFDDLKRVFVALPGGATVLHVLPDRSHFTAFTKHGTALSVIERSAYVPNLFTNTSPVDVAPTMVDWHMPQASPLFVEDLQTLAERAPVMSRNGYWSPGFAHAWPERWDYLLYFKRPTDDGLSGLPVCEVAATPEIILYKTGACAVE